MGGDGDVSSGVAECTRSGGDLRKPKLGEGVCAFILPIFSSTTGSVHVPPQLRTCTMRGSHLRRIIHEDGIILIRAGVELRPVDVNQQHLHHVSGATVEVPRIREVFARDGMAQDHPMGLKGLSRGEDRLLPVRFDLSCD